jgi:pimeloyl-ACP methyl ester carboxylesterase
MQVEVNGTRLWLDVDGPALVPDGPAMRERSTVVLLHGGPGSFDPPYFKPDFARRRGSAGGLLGPARTWPLRVGRPRRAGAFEVCADDLRAFCDALGIARAGRLRTLPRRLRRDGLRRPPRRPSGGAGAADPITPVAAAREIVDALPDRTAQLEVIERAGHFPWKDSPDRYWPLVTDFVNPPGLLPRRADGS